MKNIFLPYKAFSLLIVLLIISGSAWSTTYTWNNTAGGAWTTTTKWTPTAPTGGPAAGSDIIINSNQSAAITAVPTISLTSLSISGNCNLVPAAAGNTITVTGTFSVSAGITLSLGTSGTSRFNITMGSACIGSILGTVNVYSNTTNAAFTNNGDLTMGSAALITDGGSTNNSDFILAATGILRIGSAYGISTGTSQGATVGNIQVTGTRTYTAGADYEYKGIAAQVTGSGLTQNTPGTLIINNSAGVTLSAATTISGLLTMTSGTLNMANNNLTVGSLTGSSDITNTTGTAGARTFTIGSDNTSPAAFTGTINNGTATQVTVTKTGTGTLTLAGAGDNVGLAVNATAGTVVFAKTSDGGIHAIGGGGVTIAGGTVQLAGSGGDQIYDGCTVTINSGTFDMNGRSETIVILTGTGGSILNNGASASTLTINSTSTNTYSGIISNGSFGAGGISIVKSGSGIQTLSGLNTYTGTTTVDGGTLKAGVATTGANGAFGNASAVTLTNTSGVILDITNYNTTIGSLTGGGSTGGNVTDVSATLTVGSDNTSPAAYAGIISGSGAVTKIGTGIWTVAGNNSYTGLTTISAGTLKLGSAGSGANTPLGTTGAATSVSNGAALDLNGFTLVTAEAITINGTGVSVNGAIMNSSAAAVSYSGNITLGSASSIVADNGAITLQTGTLTGAFALTLGGTTGGTVSRVIATGAGTLIKEDAGTWTLSGLNTYTGSTTISAGIIKFGQHGAAGSGPLGTNAGGTVVANGAALDLAGFSENSTETLTLNGTGPGGAGALRNTGGADTYAGLITLGSASSINGEGGTIAISNTGTITGATFGLTLGGAQGGTISSIIGTTTGTLTKTDAGKWALSGVNTYTGATTINDGILQLGVANAIKYGASGARSNIILSGGTFSSGSAAGFTDGTSANPMGTLQLTANSNISLGTGSHSLYFAASNAVSWTASTTIIISGWAGGYNGTAGTAGKIFVGTNASGLTTGQMDQIQFFNGSSYFGTTILSTGEIVPIQNIPAISSQPADQTVCEGSTATFSSQSTGGIPAPTATWLISTGGSFSTLTIAPPYSVTTNTVSGTTTSTLTINPTPLSFSTYQYRITFTNTHGSATSNAAVLTVNATSVGGNITGANSPVCPGDGTGTLTLGGYTGTIVKWQKKLNSGTWADIVNTSNTFSEVPASAGTWYYRAVVQSGVCAAANSSEAIVVVNPRPTSVMSGTATICSGQSATLSVALTGTGPWGLTYTDGTTPVIVNSIAASPYTFPVTPASTKTYTVTALTDANCTAQAGDMTGNAVITVNTGCQVVTLTQPVALSAVISGTTTISCGSPATITVTFTGGTAPFTVTYSGTPHTGASPVTFNVSPTSTTTYDVSNLTITDAHGCSSSTTGNAVVTVTPLPAPVATDATSVTTTSFSANWNASSGATGYHLDVSTLSDFSSFVSGYNNLDVFLVTTYPVSGLTSGLTYYYRVRAYSATCTSANSNVKSVSTTSLTIGAPTVTGAPFTVDCSTPATGSISFTHGTFNGGNVFTAQLSDNAGSFTSPTPIGTGSASPISITIPANTPSGSNSYKIRVVSSAPVVTGSVSSTFTITNNPCAYSYRSVATGYWKDASTWEFSTNGTSWGAATTSPTSSDGPVTIRTGNVVTINEAVTADQITVNSGGTLKNAYNPLFDYYLKLANGTGDDLTVNGTFIANDFIENNTGATIVFGANSHYIHNIVNSKKGPENTTSTTQIPTATWNVSSTCEIQAVVMPLDGISQEFGNFTWNYPDQPFDIDLAGALTEVKGNLTISTFPGVKLQSYPVGSRSTLTVGGNLDIQTGSILELGPLQNLTITGNTSLAPLEQCLILKSTADGTASFIDNGTINSNAEAIIERYLTPYLVQDPSDMRYHFLSSPVANQPIQGPFVQLPNTTDDFFSWSEPGNEWINTKAGDPPYEWNTAFESNFIQGKGYLVAYPSPAVTKTFTGKPFTSNAGLSVTCNYTVPSLASTPGWNLIGNPFPSAVDWKYIAERSHGLLGTGMDDALYYYDNASANYLYFVDYSGGLGTASRFVPATQGIMVHAHSGSNNTVTFANAARVHPPDNTYYKSQASSSGNILDLKVEGNSFTDYARVCFAEEAGVNFDSKFDAFKLYSYNAGVPQLYTVTADNTDLSINTLPLSQMYGTVPVNFYTGTPGDFTITAQGVNTFPVAAYIKLEDKKTGIIQKLNDNPVYTFTSVTGDNSDRFLLHFQDATSVNEVATGRDFTVYAAGGVINVEAVKPVKGVVKVCDMAGREVATALMLPNQNTRINMQGHTGVYIVSVISDQGISNSKVVVK